MEENRNGFGYTHGVEQARRIVDLERRVKGLEQGVSFIGGFAGGYVGTLVLYAITDFVKGRIMGSGSTDDGRAKKEGNIIQELNKDGNTKGTNRKNVRRHARDFDIRN